MMSRINVALILVLVPAMGFSQVELGQIDDFSDGTTQGWVEGSQSNNPPVNISGGGPGGPFDAYIEVASSGTPGSSGGNQAFFNVTQWTGDYAGGGVVRISMDLLNSGFLPIPIRIGVESDIGGDRYVSRSVSIPADGAWHSVSFSLSAGSMTQVAGSATLTDVLANVGELRINSSVNPSWQGDPIVSTIGVDNITAEGAAQAPTADAGPDLFEIDEDSDGNQSVSLSASASSDLDGTIVSYQWLRDGTVFASGLSPIVVLPVGVNEITLRVTDNDGLQSEDQLVVTVATFSPLGLVSAADLDGNSVTEIATLVNQTNMPNARDGLSLQVHDASTGQRLNTVPFLNMDFEYLDLVAVPGRAADGSDAIGVLARHSAQAFLILQIKEIRNNTLLQNLFPWSANWTGQRARVVPNATAAGDQGVAVLATRKSDGLIGVQLLHADTGQEIGKLYPLGATWTALDMEVIPDMGNGTPALAVFCRRNSDGLTAVQIWDVQGAQILRNIFHLGRTFEPEEMRLVDDADGDGVEDIAVRMTRISDGLEVIQIRSSGDGGFIQNLFPLPKPNWSTLAMARVSNTNTVGLAPLSVRANDDVMLSQLWDASSRARLKNTFFLGPPWVHVLYRALPDIDLSGTSDVGVLARNGTNYLIQIRDPLSGNLIRNVVIR